MANPDTASMDEACSDKVTIDHDSIRYKCLNDVITDRLCL